jgi:hypothetical protein
MALFITLFPWLFFKPRRFALDLTKEVQSKNKIIRSSSFSFTQWIMLAHLRLCHPPSSFLTMSSFVQYQCDHQRDYALEETKSRLPFWVKWRSCSFLPIPYTFSRKDLGIMLLFLQAGCDHQKNSYQKDDFVKICSDRNLGVIHAITPALRKGSQKIKLRSLTFWWLVLR